MSQCTPAKPDLAAMYHEGFNLASVKAGGLRRFKCSDCGGNWDQPDRDTPPPIGETATPPECITMSGTREPQMAARGSKVTAADAGHDPNQVLVDAMNRVKAGETVWLALVELGTDGIPLCSWSGGPAVYPLSAAQALSYEACALLARVYEERQTEETPDHDPRGDPQ